MEERDDLADVEALASLSKKCKHSVIFSHNFIAFYDANKCQIFAAFIQFPPPSEVNKRVGVNLAIFVGRSGIFCECLRIPPVFTESVVIPSF